MVSPISSGISNNIAASTQLQQTRQTVPDEKSLEEKQAFQKFAAGTFYQTMIKSLRSTERETKYFNGGRAEKIFQGEFDQRIAASMAEEHGSPFAGPLFDQYSAIRNRESMLAAVAQTTSTSGANL